MNHKNNISANSIDPAFDFIEDSLEFTDWTFAVNFKGVNVVEYDYKYPRQKWEKLLLSWPSSLFVTFLKISLWVILCQEGFFLA